MNVNTDILPSLLARLQLTALRDQLDTLLDEAGYPRTPLVPPPPDSPRKP